MSDFKLIPVMDLFNQKVVHAVRGERRSYEPVSRKFPAYSSDPLHLLKTFYAKFEISTIYIADLNVIQNEMPISPNFRILKKLSLQPEVDIIIDLGIRNEKDIQPYMDLDFNKYILGLETLSTLGTIQNYINMYTADCIILSLDLYKGKMLTNIPNLESSSLEENLKTFQKLGVNSLILLDLYLVGSKEGGIPQLYLKILDNFEGDVFVGGGIKDIKDILNYKEEGFSGVLVGTSLYDGTITETQIKEQLGSNL